MKIEIDVKRGESVYAVELRNSEDCTDRMLVNYLFMAIRMVAIKHKIKYPEMLKMVSDFFKSIDEEENPEVFEDEGIMA